MTETNSPVVSQDKYIDIKKVIASKNPKLAKWLPGFVIGWVKRLIHQDEMNDIMSRIGHYEGMDFLKAVLIDELKLTIDVRGLENVPATGGVIIAANHPLGGIDGMAFMYAIGQVRTDMQFLVNDMLLNIKQLEQFFVPVNKVGSNPRKSTMLIEEAYRSDSAILIFPSGLVSRKKPTGIQDLKWNKSFIVKARSYKKNVIPVHIDGRNSSRFYNFSVWRHKLGIKANLEMGLLVDEMFRQRGKTIVIRIDKPVPHEELDKSRSPIEWAAEFRRMTYDLPNRM